MDNNVMTLLEGKRKNSEPMEATSSLGLCSTATVRNPSPDVVK